jgi:hypothetical protein
MMSLSFYICWLILISSFIVIVISILLIFFFDFLSDLDIFILVFVIEKFFNMIFNIFKEFLFLFILNDILLLFLLVILLFTFLLSSISWSIDHFNFIIVFFYHPLSYFIYYFTFEIQCLDWNIALIWLWFFFNNCGFYLS